MKKAINERGQSLVELSISLVVLLYLLSGAVEFGMAFFQFVQLRDAAQEGALYGSMNPTDGTNGAAIEARVRGSSSSPVNLPDPTIVSVSILVDNVLVWRDGASQGTTSSGCEGHAITVEASFEHDIFMPFIPQLIGRSTLPLNATVTDTILTPVCP
ncbi:MAG TPA: TadE/TadG family type IV pilus assembly protein [Anaerolineales bacterium]|nr:TadE/TadG family type IV pilus assembly protein [Anaerolineales bacterium]